MTEFIKLRTGKPHISFSEMSSWWHCSWRHKLQQIDKIDLSTPSPIPGFGTHIHSACEDYLKTRVMKPEIAFEGIRKMFEEHGALPGFLDSFKRKDKTTKEMIIPPIQECVDQMLFEATEILSEIPAWLDVTFPEWEFIDAEHALYEPIEGKPYAFKGFIDGVISCRGKRANERIIWLIDWKTANRAWHFEKKQDPKVQAQLVLYKTFWATKMNVPLKNIRCAFVTLKRNAKKGDRCELIPVSVGDVTKQKTLKVVNNMLATVERGIALKNRDECRWCEYKNTVHCEATVKLRLS